MPEYTDEQLAAIGARGKTIVSASAGSGKTTVMIQKMINLICKKKVGVEKKLDAEKKLGVEKKLDAENNVDDEKSVDVTRILAVTYTKKAAAQMKDKLRKALVKAINDPATSLAEKDRLKTQYNQVALADISTIHSFCGKLIRTHFYATDVGNKFGIIADDDANGNELKSRAIDKLFERSYGDGDEDFKTLLSVYFRKKNDKTLREIILKMHAKLRTHVDYRAELKASGKDTDAAFDSVCAEAYALFLNKCKLYREELSLLHGYFGMQKNCEKCVKYCETVMDVLNSWIDAGDLFTLASMSWGKVPDKPPVSPDDPPEILAAANKMHDLRTKVKKMNDFERCIVADKDEERKRFSQAAKVARALARYVLLFDEEYLRLKKLRGVLDYNDLEHYALALLENKEIAEEMRGKYDYVFVDEYQDVNPVQEKIISTVAGKNLFLVGDIKQSIYGFRGGKSKFFAQKWDEFHADQKANALKLSKNFRSASPILDAVNDQFSKMMTKKNSDVDYRADGVMQFGKRYEEGEGRVQMHILGEEEKTENEAGLDIYSVLENVSERKKILSKKVKKIKEIIDREILSEYYDIEEENPKDRRKRIQYSDIAILDRKKHGSIAEVIAALAAEGIPVSSESPVNICDFPEIKSLLDLLSLLDNRQQDIPLASVLLSAVGGFTENDLVSIRLAYQGEEKMNFRTACQRYAEEQKDALADRLKEFYAYFDGLRHFAQIHGAGEVLTKVISEKGLEASYLAGLNGENCLKRIHRLIEETQVPETLDVHGFLLRLRMLDYDLPYCENGGENSVKVMTMHASKGLEFPVVILANLNRDFTKGQNDEVDYVEGFGLAPNAFDLSNMTYSSTVLRLLASRRGRLERVRDEMNLYYVALTRAKYVLHVIFEKEVPIADVCYGKSYAELTDFETWEKYKMDGACIDLPPPPPPLEFNEVDETIVEGIKRAWDWEYAHSGCENMPAKTSATTMMKLAEEKDEKEDDALSALLLAALAEEDPFTPVDLHELSRASETDTLIGSAYHAFLEHFDFSALSKDVSDEALGETILTAIEEMREQSLLSEEYLDVLDVAKLKEILKNPVFYRLSDVKLYKEQRFMAALPSSEVLSMIGKEKDDCPSCDEEMLFQGAIDLLAKGEDFAEIIDYKYSQKGAKALRETYSMQLKLYRMAMAKALHMPIENIRCTIVNIYRGFEIEIE